MTNSPSSSDKRDVLAKVLTGVPPADYGDQYRAHLLEQYKKYLDMADKISDRRSTANTFFLTVNTGLISAFGVVNLTGQKLSPFLLMTGCFAAIVLCYTWSRLVRSYRDLNSAKFKVVHEMENNLPMRPFDAEWEAVGRGLNRKLYWPFTHIEKNVPWIFIVIYLLVIGFSIYQAVRS